MKAIRSNVILKWKPDKKCNQLLDIIRSISVCILLKIVTPLERCFDEVNSVLIGTH